MKENPGGKKYGKMKQNCVKTCKNKAKLNKMGGEMCTYQLKRFLFDWSSVFMQEKKQYLFFRYRPNVSNPKMIMKQIHVDLHFSTTSSFQKVLSSVA